MPFETEVAFRGEKRVIIFTHEGDGVFDWTFDGVDAATHDALAMTLDEEMSIQEQCWDYWNDWVQTAYYDD